VDDHVNDANSAAKAIVLVSNTAKPALAGTCQSQHLLANLLALAGKSFECVDCFGVQPRCQDSMFQHAGDTAVTCSCVVVCTIHTHVVLESSTTFCLSMYMLLRLLLRWLCCCWVCGVPAARALIC
jgi:hypothetical protein